MISIYICDDDTQIQEHIKKIVQNYITIENLDMQIQSVFSKPKELIHALEYNHNRNIYFLDVDLKDDTYDGFRLAKEIRSHDTRGFITFITSHDELAYETFNYRLEAMDYIPKHDIEVLQTRITHVLQDIQQTLSNERGSSKAYYQVKVFDKIYNIAFDDIMFFETSSSKNKVILHTKDETIEFYDKLSTLEENLGEDFIRTHRAFLVYRPSIKTVHLQDSSIELKNGEHALLSRKGKKLL